MDSGRVRPRTVGECRVARAIANGSLSAPVRRWRNTGLVLRRRWGRPRSLIVHSRDGRKALLTHVARDAVDLTAGVFTTTGYTHRNELRLANRACHNDQAAFVVLGISNALSHRDRGIRRCRRLALGARQLSVGRVGCFRQSGRSKLRRSGYKRRPRYIRDLRYGGLSASCRRGALAFRRSSL
jgi:hypothetical protein